MMSCLAAQGDRGAGSEGGGESGFPEYLVAVRATHDHQHSCSRPDCAVRLSAALSLPHSSSLPPSYVCLDSSQLGELRRAYCRLHCQRPTIPPAARLLQHPPPTLDPPLPTTCKEVVFPDRASLEAAAAAARMAGASAAARAAAGAADAAAPSDVARLLGALQQVVSTAGGGGHAEWERGLHVLAAALSQHCRTRSADEVLAFMRNEESSAPKRLQVESQQPPQPAVAPPAVAAAPLRPPSLAEVQHGIFDLAGHLGVGVGGGGGGGIAPTSAPASHEIHEHGHSQPMVCDDCEAEGADAGHCSHLALGDDADAFTAGFFHSHFEHEGGGGSSSGA